MLGCRVSDQTLISIGIGKTGLILLGKLAYGRAGMSCLEKSVHRKADNIQRNPGTDISMRKKHRTRQQKLYSLRIIFLLLNSLLLFDMLYCILNMWPLIVDTGLEDNFYGNTFTDGVENIIRSIHDWFFEDTRMEIAPLIINGTDVVNKTSEALNGICMNRQAEFPFWN